MLYKHYISIRKKGFNNSKFSGKINKIRPKIVTVGDQNHEYLILCVDACDVSQLCSELNPTT